MPITVSQNGLEVEHQPFGKGHSYAEIFGNGDNEHPMTCGVFAMERSEPVASEYPCSEFTVVLEGEIDAEDLAKPGEIVKLKAGDIIHVDKGSTVRWSSPTRAKGFYVIQVEKGTDPQPFIRE